MANSAKRFDPFLNVLPRPVELLNKLPTNELQGLRNIEETDGLEDFQVILDQPYWRIIHNAVKWYPNLGLKLPYTVVAELYRYSKLFWEDAANDLLWVSLPDKREYYEMFITELSINEKMRNHNLLQIFQSSLFLVIGMAFLIIQCIYLKM